MSLVVSCLHVLARFPDLLPHDRTIPPLNVLVDAPDPCLWATIAQLVRPLPPAYHDYDISLSHPDLLVLQNIPDSPNFSLVTLLSLPNCTHLDISILRSLHRLLALDLRGCSVSSHALARGLVPGPRRLRLLSLYGCPNIDDDVLVLLIKFPLLSAIDLRFTRCTPTATNARLSPLGFLPSENNALFHPAPLALSLCSLEKIAHPISLYACPPQSVFRMHINDLGRLPSRVAKITPVTSSSTSVRTTSSAEDTVFFFPPLRKQVKRSSTPTSAVPASSLVDPPNLDSNVSSFYAKAPTHTRKNLLPLSAQAVRSSQNDQSDPLAIARPPPPWSSLQHHDPLATPSRRTQPTARWIGQTLDNPLRIDRARLHKRSSDAVADMVHQFARKRPKVESEFALAKSKGRAAIKSRNPFVKNVRSVFAESTTDVSNDPPSPVPDVPLRSCQSLPSMTVQDGTSTRPLKPITSLKPPILPKELLPRRASKPRTDLKQTRLSFAPEVE